jgi:tRNA(Ile)-lysidine synthase
MIATHLVNELQKSSNLLAFSAGVDSTALFFLLVEAGVEFDLIMVDYNLRDQSKAEVAYAKHLCKIYKKELFLHETNIEKSSNLEKQARDIRYQFFDETITQEGYDFLLTAHQLNDRLEWFLMQLSKGSGVDGLMGMEEVSERSGYKLLRPLLPYTKTRLRDYLITHNYHYFEDKSNDDQTLTRNYFRHNFSNRLIEEFGEGIERSFNYLDHERTLLDTLEILYNKDEYYIISSTSPYQDQIAIDKILKRLGLIISKAQRDEILRTKDCVVSGQIAVVYQDDQIHIAPFIEVVMEKEFKESMRIKRVPAKIRGYIYDRET